ncbi:MAG: tRNA epoxyqueuosine(34) reductase QueG [Planctomycetes bacterium]|nr:tRNA epoxyqueuosine(34) reductase QueG [Planctomycetota bacterium]
MNERIRARALELGFDRCGFARAGRSRDADRLHAWLAAGRDAGLGYMRSDPERRADPRRVVAQCRSVVVVTLNHFSPDPVPRAELPAQVARYARGRDYHRVAASMLRKLSVSMHALSGPGHTHRWYVDDGPVLERAWAVEAGIGFAGKNACTIDPERGSWFLLAVVLSTLELAPDAPVRESCGTCSACIPACPTGAIVGPGQVDARRCISFWTIEQRGAIPVDMRPLVGTRVFGCDDCQAACPWNRFARATSVADLRPREMFVDPDLAVLAGLSRDEFDRRTEGSPVRRAGYEGFLRNVAVALGNTGDVRARPHLERLAASGPAIVREHAAWGLSRLDAAAPSGEDRRP